MKSFKTSLLLLSLCSLSVLGQEKKFLFKQIFKPNSEYSMMMNNDSDSHLKISGDEATTEEIEKSGVTNNQNFKANTNCEIKITTSEQTKNEVPFTWAYEKMSFEMDMNGEKIQKDIPLNGVVITGKYVAGNKTVFDEIKGENIDEAKKAMFNQILKNTYDNVDFPENGLSIGESFTQTYPFEMQLPTSSSLKMKINTTYKLMKVENQNAYFDLEQNFVMTADSNSDALNMNIEATGNGKGKTVFDMTNNFFSDKETDISMNMKLNMPQNMIMEINSANHLSVKILKNK